ncbi:MAG: metallophosphoesterase, partial [Chitinophagales bacterium]
MTRLIAPILFVILLMFLIDLYAFQAFKAGFRSELHWIKWSYWAVGIASMACVLAILFIPIPLWPDALRTYIFAVILLLYLSKLFVVFFLLLEDTGRFLRWSFSFFGDEKTEGTMPDRAAFFGKLTIVFGAIPLLSGIYGMVKNAYNYQLHRTKVKLPHLPKSFQGFKIVQISDIHSGSFTAKKPILRAIEMINREKPDIVLFTGDLVNNRADEFLPYLEYFAQIKAKEGIYSCLGNHDYGDYYRWKDQAEKDENMQLLQDMQRKMGWQLLLNENR